MLFSAIAATGGVARLDMGSAGLPGRMSPTVLRFSALLISFPSISRPIIDARLLAGCPAFNDLVKLRKASCGRESLGSQPLTDEVLKALQCWMTLRLSRNPPKYMASMFWHRHCRLGFHRERSWA